MLKRTRSLLIASLFFITAASSSFAGGDEDALKEIYLRAFNMFQQAGAEHRAGNFRLAREQFEGVSELLEQIQRENPDWQKSIVDYLKTESEQALKGMQDYKSGPPAFSERGFREVSPAVDISRLEAEVEKYQSLITQQETKLNQLLGDADQARQTYQTSREQLEKDRETLQKQLNETGNKLTQAELTIKQTALEHENAVQKLNREMEKLKAESSQVRLRLEKEKTALELEKKAALDKSGGLEKELSLVKAEFGRTKLALEQANREREKEALSQKEQVSAVLKERDLLREQVTQVSLAIQERDTQTAKMQSQISQSQDELKIAQREFERERLVSKSLEKEKETLTARLAQVQSGYDKLVSDYKNRNQDIEGRLKNSESEKIASSQELTRLKLALDTADKDKAAAVEREGKLAGEIAGLKKELQDAQERGRVVTEKKDRENKLAAELEQEKTRRIALAQANEDLNKKLQEKEEALVDAVSQKEIVKNELEAKLAGLQSEKGAVEQKLVSVSQRYDGMMKELNTSFDKVKQALETKLASAQKGVEEQAQTIRDKEAQLQTLMVDYKKKYQTAMLNLQKNYEDQLGKLNEKIQLLETATKTAQTTTAVVTTTATAEPKKEPAKVKEVIVQKEQKKEQEELVQKVTESKTNQGKMGPPVYDRNAILFYNQGVDLAEKGEILQAQTEFKKALEIFPQFFEAHYNLGRTYVMQGKKKEAIEEYNLALAIKEDADVYYGLGAIYWEMGNWDKVIENWELALKIFPEHPLANQWLPKAREKFQSASASASQS